MLKTIFVAAALLATPALAQDAPPAGDQPGPASHAAPTPEMRAAMQNVRQACTTDIASFCKDVQPGGGKVARCLREHRSEISDGCKAAFQNLRAARQASAH